MKFRDLTADEIEVRVASVSEKGVSLLLYKNARVDANILDETVGAENWQNKFYECKGNLYCSVGINTNFSIPESPERWIWKDDCGRESDYEKVKGEASDAFKRACATKWSIGRELYTSPFIWVTDCKIERGTNGKLTCKDFFKVSKIEIVNKKITKLEIKRKNKVVFSYGYDRKAKPEVKESEKPVICPKCGIQILNTPTRSGKILSPDEVLRQWGMCENCKREELEIQKELEQLKNERK